MFKTRQSSQSIHQQPGQDEKPGSSRRRDGANVRGRIGAPGNRLTQPRQKQGFYCTYIMLCLCIYVLYNPWPLLEKQVHFSVTSILVLYFLCFQRKSARSGSQDWKIFFSRATIAFQLFFIVYGMLAIQRNSSTHFIRFVQSFFFAHFYNAMFIQ